MARRFALAKSRKNHEQIVNFLKNVKNFWDFCGREMQILVLFVGLWGLWDGDVEFVQNVKNIQSSGAKCDKIYKIFASCIIYMKRPWHYCEKVYNIYTKYKGNCFHGKIRCLILTFVWRCTSHKIGAESYFDPMPGGAMPSAVLTESKSKLNWFRSVLEF